jgi:hypothetical protein
MMNLIVFTGLLSLRKVSRRNNCLENGLLNA